jgi:hypothetical protein
MSAKDVSARRDLLSLSIGDLDCTPIFETECYRLFWARRRDLGEIWAQLKQG